MTIVQFENSYLQQQAILGWRDKLLGWGNISPEADKLALFHVVSKACAWANTQSTACGSQSPPLFPWLTRPPVDDWRHAPRSVCIRHRIACLDTYEGHPKWRQTPRQESTLPQLGKSIPRKWHERQREFKLTFRIHLDELFFFFRFEGIHN